jgi:hypothetical protein
VKFEQYKAFFNPLFPQLYALAYVLLPDDLQAQQLMIDAFTRHFHKKDIGFDGLDFLQDETSAQRKRREIFKILSKTFLELGQLRSKQMNVSAHPKEEDVSVGAFWELDLQSRFVLWMHLKQGVSLEELEKKYQMSFTKSQQILLSWRQSLKLKKQKENFVESSQASHSNRKNFEGLR